MLVDGKYGYVDTKGKTTIVPQFAQAQSFSAVSYTHLRAHETVLDLVCRLLLEKKNNYPYNIVLNLPCT